MATTTEDILTESVEALEVEDGPTKIVAGSEIKTETQETMVDAKEEETPTKRKGLKVLFLSSDTGGGHRASAESLANQFQILFPGTTYDLLDVVEKDGVAPYNSLVSYYKHLSARPTQWKLVYNVSNSRAFEMLADAHLKLMCERAVRKSIKSYDPDVVVSVHPLMTNVPVLSCSKISNETGRHLPIFTVVTDLGSAHCLWFANGVEKMFVGSEAVKKLAMVRGKVPEEKIVLAGLPIRHGFAVQSEKLGDRNAPEGLAYQRSIREELKLPYLDRKTILVMGGGEGVGSLSNIVDALYYELRAQGIDALLLVICGRNEKLKTDLVTRDWLEIFRRFQAAKERHGASNGLISMSLTDACGGNLASAGCMETGVVTGTVTGSIRRMLSTGTLTKASAMSTPAPDQHEEEKKTETHLSNSILGESHDDEDTVAFEGKSLGNVHVMPLGFISNMDEYMVAADVLVSKAGPGTIMEAASVSLPIMLTSFLPGQEEGNVDFVTEGGFGAFVNDTDPIGIAEEVCIWMTDPDKLAEMSKAAKALGNPYAARDIAKQIGDSTLKWVEINQELAAKEKQAAAEKTAKEAEDVVLETHAS